MTSQLFRTGLGVLEYEVAEERASALGRLGRRLEDALAALAAAPRETTDRHVREGLLRQAAYALWLLVVQREAIGLNNVAHVLRTYDVPNEVYVRMGPMPQPRKATAR